MFGLNFPPSQQHALIALKMGGGEKPSEGSATASSTLTAQDTTQDQARSLSCHQVPGPSEGLGRSQALFSALLRG